MDFSTLIAELWCSASEGGSSQIKELTLVSDFRNVILTVFSKGEEMGGRARPAEPCLPCSSWLGSLQKLYRVVVD